MNNDTISRKAAIDALRSKLDKTAKGDIGSFYNTIIRKDIECLKQLPSAERNGWWSNGFCSVCGEEALTEWNDTGGEYAFTKFCPNCGAKMDIAKGE